jgi:hypothetical protein
MDIMKDYKEAYIREVRNRSKSPTFGQSRLEDSVNQVSVGPSNQVVQSHQSQSMYQTQKQAFAEIKNRCGMGSNATKTTLNVNDNIKKDLINGLFGSQKERQLLAKKRCLNG